MTQDTDDNRLLTLYNFERVLKNMNISEKVMTHDDIVQLFKAYAKDHNKINYLTFCEEIGKTYLDDDNAYSGSSALLEKTRKPRSPRGPRLSQRTVSRTGFSSRSSVSLTSLGKRYPSWTTICCQLTTYVSLRRRRSR